jgi:hypothetical protein
VWFWAADGLNEQLKMLREWRTSVERGEAEDASVEELSAIIEDKERLVGQVEAKAKEVAEGLGRELEKVELPKTYQQAAGDPHLFGLYTKGFRHLSGSIHVSATLFTENRYGEAMTLDEGLGDDDFVGRRGIVTPQAKGGRRRGRERCLPGSSAAFLGGFRPWQTGPKPGDGRTAASRTAAPASVATGLAQQFTPASS